MTTFLLIIIAIMVLVTMVCSLITTIIEVKDEHAQELVKKILSVVGVALLIVAVIGLAFGVSNTKDDKEKTNNTYQNEGSALEKAGFNEVTLDEYLELIKSPEKNIVLIARPSCGFCEQFTPILKQAAEDMGLIVNYINTEKLSNDDWTVFNNSLDYLKNNEWGTPLTLIVQNGDTVAENSGYVELDTIKDFFKSNGLGN